MGDLQATVEFLVELYKFYNVDLFIRGYYQFRLTFKPPKSSHAIQVEMCEGHGERGAFTLFPAFVTNDGQTAVSRTFNIYYKDEEVLLKDIFLFRVHLLIDSTKAADCIDKTALEMTVDVHFTDQVIRQNTCHLLPLVTSRTLKFHFSCFNGLHHQVPLLFDYYYFSVLDLIFHANVVSLGLPNWSILKPIKTGWFSKSNATPRTSTPLFYTTLFGNRSQLGPQFYSDNALRYAVSSFSSVSRESFEKASAIHRNLCAILAMAHSQLLQYFDKMMDYFDEKQIIRLADQLDPADLVEGLCKKLETLQSCEEVFDEMCSDMSLLNNELALLWLQFQESFTLSDQIRPVLREQHHRERMMHFSEAFFVHQLPWNSLLNATDSSFQKHVSMGQCVKSSRYLSIIPAVTVECADVDGDSSSTPIFFEDRYVNTKEKSPEHVKTVSVGNEEDDILEHKPLSFGILNQAFNDYSPQATDSAGSSDDVEAKDVWVDIKSPQDGIAARDVIAVRETRKEDNTTEFESTEVDNEVKDGLDGIVEGGKGISLNVEANEDSSVADKENSLENLAGEVNTTIANKETGSKEKVVSNNASAIEASNDILSIQLMDVVEKCVVEKENLKTENLGKRNLENVVAPQEVNDVCKSQDNEEHCRTLQDMNTSNKGTMVERITNGNQVRNVSDIIATLDNHPMPVSNLSNVLLESNPNTNGPVILDEEINAKVDDCLGTSAVKSDNTNSKLTGDCQELRAINCLAPNGGSDTIVQNLETAEYGAFFDSDKKPLLSGLPELEQQKQNSNDKIIAQSAAEGKDAIKKISSIKYVGSSNATKENLRKVVSASKNEPFNNAKKVKLGSDNKNGSCSSNPSTLLASCTIVSQPDKSQGVSKEKDNANSTNGVPDNPAETTLLIDTERKGKTEAMAKEPEFSDLSRLTDDISEQPLETAPNATKNTSEDDPDKSSKTRNTAQLTLSRRSSNSVFYARVNSEDSISKQSLLNKKVSDATLDKPKLSSNSSTDAISCFCGGKLEGKLSSPYRPSSESDTSNIVLHKAKKDVISRMNYCGTLYSDCFTEFVVQPYFIIPKPDLSMEPVHFVVCVHGLDGNSGDLRLLRCFLEMALPSTKFEFLMSEVNQDNTFVTFEKLTEKLVSEILHHMEAYRISPSRISFIGHSLGNIIIRSVLNHPLMEPYVELFHTFLSLSGPHLGMVYHTSSLVSTGMWFLQKWKKSDSLLQLSLNDSTDMRDTFIYKLSKKKGLEYFKNVLLVSSVQDHYVPFHSSRIELPKTMRSNSQEYIVHREMMENLLTPLLDQPDRSLVRYSVYHCLPSSTNTFIGRAAHIAMLDSELFIEKLICTSAAKYFQ